MIVCYNKYYLNFIDPSSLIPQYFYFKYQNNWNPTNNIITIHLMNNECIIKLQLINKLIINKKKSIILNLNEYYLYTF